MTQDQIVAWKPVESAPDNVPVNTKIDNEQGCRNEGILIRDGNLWWFTDRSMYVYYRPTHWREMTDGEIEADYLERRDKWKTEEPKRECL